VGAADVSTLQILLNIAVTAANGLAIFAIGWLIDRRRAAFSASGEGIIRATIIASIFATGLWFLGFVILGDGINPYGTILMGGSGGAIATMAAIILYRRRRLRPANPRTEALRDTFS
jgi:hypothetical protein